MADYEICSCDEALQLREDIKFLLGVIDNTFPKFIPRGLGPTGYYTSTYEGDLQIADRIREIKERVL